MATLADQVKAAAQSLVFAAGLASAVQSADVAKAADTISRKYATTSVRQIEEDIRNEIRKG